MIIRYLVDGKPRRVNDTNEDIEVFEQRKDNRHTVKIKAKKDLVLADATEVIPFAVNFKDLYFLNGYQSWTDTKEFKLAKRLRNVKKSPHLVVKMFGLDKYGDATFYDYSIRPRAEAQLRGYNHLQAQPPYYYKKHSPKVDL